MLVAVLATVRDMDVAPEPTWMYSRRVANTATDSSVLLLF
ncbi:MAG: hypothetical protein RLZZ385_2405 [Pseudomonadota bacterium]|jgi:hypothetical protein